MKFIKCEICNSEISEEKCVFATCKKKLSTEKNTTSAVNAMPKSLKEKRS